MYMCLYIHIYIYMHISLHTYIKRQIGAHRKSLRFNLHPIERQPAVGEEAGYPRGNLGRRLLT